MSDYKTRNKVLQCFIDFILLSVEDYQNDEVQKRINQIETLYWECFDKYE